jgi:hypothetical protein
MDVDGNDVNVDVNNIDENVNNPEQVSRGCVR